MADFTINVAGETYTSRDEAIEAVRAAWDAWKAENADPLASSADPADYLRFKAEHRPDDDEWDGADEDQKAITREVFAANLAAADARREAAAE